MSVSNDSCLIHRQVQSVTCKAKTMPIRLAAVLLITHSACKLMCIDDDDLLLYVPITYLPVHDMCTVVGHYSTCTIV
jgi:hypothetical protein